MRTLPHCCGHEMRQVVISTSAPTGLVAYLCAECKRSQWRQDGRRVTRSQALDSAIELDQQMQR
jgi:hypothetical protein